MHIIRSQLIARRLQRHLLAMQNGLTKSTNKAGMPHTTSQLKSSPGSNNYNGNSTDSSNRISRPTALFSSSDTDYSIRTAVSIPRDALRPLAANWAGIINRPVDVHRSPMFWAPAEIAPTVWPDGNGRPAVPEGNVAPSVPATHDCKFGLKQQQDSRDWCVVLPSAFAFETCLTVSAVDYRAALAIAVDFGSEIKYG